jgi:hypothetical protein
MTHMQLLPHAFKIWGWVLFGMGLAIGIVGIINGGIDFGITMTVPAFFNSGLFSKEFLFFDWIENELTDEILTFCLIIGGLFIGFSAEKDEDEMTVIIRLKALTWAVVANYSILLLATALIYDLSYLNVMIYNMFTIIVIFVARYQYLLYTLRKMPLS